MPKPPKRSAPLRGQVAIKANEVIDDQKIVTIIELYLTQHTQVEIAKQLSMSQVTVSNYIAEAQRRWREATVIKIDTARNKELDRLDLLEREYWKIWRDSVQSKEPKKEYLDGVLKCIQERAKIIGIYSQVGTGETGVIAPTILNFVNFSQTAQRKEQDQGMTTNHVTPLEIISRTKD